LENNRKAATRNAAESNFKAAVSHVTAKKNQVSKSAEGPYERDFRKRASIV
jgi:hypothetical protein